jgi:hypothetical protein
MPSKENAFLFQLESKKLIPQFVSHLGYNAPPIEVRTSSAVFVCPFFLASKDLPGVSPLTEN